jgi:hypothetical protein
MYMCVEPAYSVFILSTGYVVVLFIARPAAIYIHVCTVTMEHLDQMCLTRSARSVQIVSTGCIFRSRCRFEMIEIHMVLVVMYYFSWPVVVYRLE